MTTRVGIALALAVVVAAAAYSMGRRRREVQLGAGTRGPVSAGLLYAAELVPVAVVAGVVGWLAARGVVSLTVGSSTPTRSVLREAGLWTAAAVVAALVASAAVAAVANRVETRRLEGRPEVRLPWVLVLVVVAASATGSLLTRPPAANDTLGPLDLLVPPLVVAAVAAVGSRIAFGILRRTRAASRPPSRRTVATWLARRRLQAPDRGREAATTVAATGLAMLAFSLASLSSLQVTVEDRAAVAAGAVSVHRVDSSWQLDPGVAQQAVLPKDGSPLKLADVPVTRNPALPQGQSTVWRGSTSVATSEVGSVVKRRHAERGRAAGGARHPRRLPGRGPGPPTLVVPADSFFASQFNEDPRLRPARGAPGTGRWSSRRTCGATRSRWGSSSAWSAWRRWPSRRYAWRGGPRPPTGCWRGREPGGTPPAGPGSSRSAWCSPSAAPSPPSRCWPCARSARSSSSPVTGGPRRPCSCCRRRCCSAAGWLALAALAAVGGETHALRGVDAEFHEHTVTALTGPSGSGKSTLLALLALRDRPSGGDVTIRGRPASSLRTRDRRRHSRRVIAWVPQRPTDGVYPHLTAAQNVEQAARWRGAPSDAGYGLLERLGLADVSGVAASRLSGGEQQRVALACACVGAPPLILCDEPTAELDEDTAGLVMHELRSVAAGGSAVVIATHDPGAVAASDRVVALRHGVMSTEQWGATTARATIDPAGRVQLPPDALELFPNRRAVIRVDGDRVVLEPTGEEP